MTDIKELKKKRSSYKGRLTVFSNYLSTFEVSKLTTSQVIELQLRVSKFESILNEFDDIQLQIECLSDNSDSELTERISYESQYFKVLAQAKDMLNSYSKSEHDCSESKSVHSVSNRQLVKLPTIQLPKFSGLYENWLEFRDTFSSLIHDNHEIDKVNKFHYLRSSLEGSAAVVIQSVEFSSQNYDVAWQLLCERFNNKRLLIQNHVSELFNLDKISKESSSSLKRLLDQVNKNIRALRSLGEPVDSWDTLLIYIIVQKLDSQTFREWEQDKGILDKNKPIALSTLLDFIRNRADFIETLEMSHKTQNSGSSSNSTPKSKSKIKAMVSIAEPSPTKCPKCDANHSLNSCPTFLAMSINDRLSSLPTYKVCYNCFRIGHYANRCKKPGCKICKRKHQTLIHMSDYRHSIGAARHNISDQAGGSRGAAATPSAVADSRARAVSLSANVTASSSASVSGEVLLSTALIKVYDANNSEHVARALLDSGSSSCLITERLFNKLKLASSEINKSIQGINNSLSHVTKLCRVHIKSLSESYSFNLQCFVLPVITDNVPVKRINISHLKIPSDIQLADPNFYAPAPIDLIIGADVFWSLLTQQSINLGIGEPTLCQTTLGWLVCGPINGGYVSTSTTPIKCNFINIDNDSSHFNKEFHDIQNQLSRFWQIEEVCSQSSTYSPEERQCEEHFVKNTTRLNDGRFCVRIPLKNSPDLLGDSFQRAKHCFFSLERRNQSRPEFNKMYTDFMSEYASLNHMTKCEANSDKKTYFIPHHGVLRENSLTTKLRVVFNASAPTTSGVSFNDIQMVGPTVQDDLFAILLRFRLHKYVLSADIEKMYRQISVHPLDRSLQQIVWRDNSANLLETYQLNTVTYGTASAPYLATRCLKQIGFECSDIKVAEVITHDFYIDDLLTGHDSINEARLLRENVTKALAAACMPLRKWKSNEPTLAGSQLNQSSFDLNIGGIELNKTLGLGWHTDLDELCFPISVPVHNKNTKRDILSLTAQIFDPLGLLAPIVIRMKMLLQRLWLEKLSWDESLSPEISKIWLNLVESLSALIHVRIPRRVVCDSYNRFELHIFSDASEQAYGACVYVRSTNNRGDVWVQLLVAKSRVAPIKPTTIPRLELCAALVGARLYNKVISSLRMQVTHVTFWSDSMVVLGWLKMLPIKLHTFVRNRVAEILETTNKCTWRHVPTQNNPADLISRGVDARTIHSLELWWSGPSFLKQDENLWPLYPGATESLPEVKTNVCLHLSVKDNNIIDFKRFSNFLRLQRAVAYSLRFINACKRKYSATTYLNNDELQNALNQIMIQSQSESFPEYNLLLNKHKLPSKSPLLKFNVFLDDNKIMRVGGRLVNSEFSYDKKHPIIIQSTHHVSKLLFRHQHIKLMHAGPQLLLATIREEYWPIGGRNLAKTCYHDCLRCRRIKGQTLVPQMGNLPHDRLSPAVYPFQNVGVDYAGPILSAARKGRGCKLVKVYIVIFVCFTTKAIHLELVGDLTSDNYLQALRRFMSRRGKPLNIYSDNGTSFVGAYHELSKFLKTNCSSLSESLTNNEGINFHFIPAYAPHFGGLWEAGVKSTKYHLMRVLGNCNLTYEELNTTLVQIEGILNSRPLTPLSSDPEDMLPLTPGHFIIGRAITSLPVKDLRDSSSNYLTRHQRIEQLRQHFWERWNKEYISELQTRVKWRASKDSLKLNSLVVVKEDNLPPLKWRLGRVTALYPGTDGLSRVADIKTANGTIRRAYTKICPLLDPDNSG